MHQPIRFFQGALHFHIAQSSQQPNRIGIAALFPPIPVNALRQASQALRILLINRGGIKHIADHPKLRLQTFGQPAPGAA